MKEPPQGYVPDPPGGYSDVIAFLYAGLINEKISYRHLITVNLLLSRILPDPDCCYNTKHIQNVQERPDYPSVKRQLLQLLQVSPQAEAP